MNLRSGVVAVVLAAAGGAAVARAFPAPEHRSEPSLEIASPRPRATGGDLDRGHARGGADSIVDRGAVVYVAGEVVRPGVYRVSPRARAVDALHLAGGPTKTADLVAVNLAALVEDGAEIVVPPKGGATVLGPPLQSRSRLRSSRSRALYSASPTRRAHRKRRPASRSETSDGALPVVNVNAADAATLESLPGIGPALATRIVAFREVNGSFTSVDDLLDVAGMTQGKADALAVFVTFR